MRRNGKRQVKGLVRRVTSKDFLDGRGEVALGGGFIWDDSQPYNPFASVLLLMVLAFSSSGMGSLLNLWSWLTASSTRSSNVAE